VLGADDEVAFLVNIFENLRRCNYRHGTSPVKSCDTANTHVLGP
jgi:hypothetical protein